MHVGALVFHMFVISLFFGFLAMAIGAWTGSPGMASGVTAGVMFISFVGAGLFPIIEEDGRTSPRRSRGTTSTEAAR